MVAGHAATGTRLALRPRPRPPARQLAAYPDIADVDGLEESCRRGRALGMWGRTAVHPSQVEVIRRMFTPSAAELAWARAVLDVLHGTGVAKLPDGSMVGAAMERRARSILS